MKLERLIAMIYKLLNHEVLSASVLAEQFQVSQRTIYRDIDVLCAAGLPIVSYQGSSGGYGIIDGYKMDKSLLGAYDVDSLITVLTSLSTVFQDERAQSTIERLQTIAPEHHNSNLAINFDTYRTEPYALVYLRQGITDTKVVHFDYINANNEHTHRKIEPLWLHFKYSTWYVHGFCQSKQDYREFRLSRMMDVQLTTEDFHPHPSTPQNILQTEPEWEKQLKEIVIRVAPQSLAEAMDQFQQADKTFQSDGSMIMRIPIYKPLEAKWLWSILLSFGSGAEVLEPAELRVILKQQLEQALHLYKEV
ncbi:YafY family protein [Paenibacillus sp. PsM32]|uniref:helix-turn-helix transcriptional regulator n=1 Tax=Paenibacillus sp. PsM32 TaxID=3030536 RepID=UPI00263BC7D8|nr:YafY family protein [Paenibacillus sp. PsM32]MDN4618312.1 YafY family protein [Paenibacillus sp. PsM32]